MGLDLRPILYGYILHIVLSRPSVSEKEENVLKPEKEQPEPLWKSKELTRREREIAELAARGLSNREIAEELCITETTVKKHLSNIFEKLEINSRERLK